MFKWIRGLVSRGPGEQQQGLAEVVNKTCSDPAGTTLLEHTNQFQVGEDTTLLPSVSQGHDESTAGSAYKQNVSVSCTQGQSYYGSLEYHFPENPRCSRGGNTEQAEITQKEWYLSSMPEMPISTQSSSRTTMSLLKPASSSDAQVTVSLDVQPATSLSSHTSRMTPHPHDAHMSQLTVTSQTPDSHMITSQSLDSHMITSQPPDSRTSPQPSNTDKMILQLPDINRISQPPDSHKMASQPPNSYTISSQLLDKNRMTSQTLDTCLTVSPLPSVTNTTQTLPDTQIRTTTLLAQQILPPDLYLTPQPPSPGDLYLTPSPGNIYLTSLSSPDKQLTPSSSLETQQESPPNAHVKTLPSAAAHIQLTTLSPPNTQLRPPPLDIQLTMPPPSLLHKQLTSPLPPAAEDTQLIPPTPEAMQLTLPAAADLELILPLPAAATESQQSSLANTQLIPPLLPPAVDSQLTPLPATADTQLRTPLPPTHQSRPSAQTRQTLSDTQMTETLPPPPAVDTLPPDIPLTTPSSAQTRLLLNTQSTMPVAADTLPPSPPAGDTLPPAWDTLPPSPRAWDTLPPPPGDTPPPAGDTQPPPAGDTQPPAGDTPAGDTPPVDTPPPPPDTLLTSPSSAHTHPISSDKQMKTHSLDPKQTLEALQTLLADSGKETTKYEVVENKQKDETFFEKSDLGMHSSCRNPYPCCYRSTCLYGHSGQLCTVLGNRWILAELEGAFVLVYVDLQVLGNQRYTCRILWRGEKPIPLSEVPDGTRVQFDAITSPNSEILQALVIWTERKPTICIDTNDEHSYMFIDGRGLICDLSSLNTNDRDIRVKFDDNVVSVEVCDDVIFMDGNKSKMMHLHKDNSSPVYATVFKLLQGDAAGTLKYVCTCLWTGQRPPINALPMNLKQRKTYIRKSHGLYIQSKCMNTLYCDVDSMPSVSKNVGKLTFSIDDIKQLLPFTRDQLYSTVKGQSPSLTCKGNLKAHILKQEHDSEDAKWTVLMIKSHLSSLCMVGNSCGRINEKSNNKALQIPMDENENLANIEGKFKKEVVHKNAESNELINASHTQDEKTVRDKINSNSQVKPQPKSTTSLASQVKPLTSSLNNQVTPQTSSTTSLNSKVKPQTSNTTSLNNQARPQTSSTTSLDKARPQTSSTSSLNSQGRSQTSSISSLCNKLRPQTSSATSLSSQQELQNYVKHGAVATQPTLDCLTCSVAEVQGDMVILRAAGKFILATKENIFFNQAKITKHTHLKSELKKFQTVGTVFYEVNMPIDIWGYTVQHVAVLAWAGKKPPDANDIIRNWNPQNLLLKNNYNSLSPGIQGNGSTKDKIFDASCCIIEIVLDIAILVVRSKYLQEGTGKMAINISNLFIDGLPVTKKQLKSLPSDNLWHCLVQQGSLQKEKDRQSEFVVTLAWQGKKPSSSSYSSQIRETQPCNSSNTHKICNLVKPQTKSATNSVKPNNSITGSLTSQKKPQNTNTCTLANKVGSQPSSISKLTNKVMSPSNDNNPKVANQPELEYFTCSLVEVETTAVILRAAKKFILLQNKNLFINEERVSDSRMIKSMLKNFLNIGAIIYEANISMDLYGYNIKHVAVVGWAGKKPLDAENIVKTWKSKPFVLWKGKIESQSSKIHKENAPHKDETLKTGCKIIKVSQDTGILKIYSKSLENGMGEAEVSISNMYKDGQRVSKKQLGQLPLHSWNCIVQKRFSCKVKTGQPDFIATLAWHGKKPSSHPLSKDQHQHSISKDNLGSGMWPQTTSTSSLTSQLRPQASSTSSLKSQGRSQTSSFSSEVRPQTSSTSRLNSQVRPQTNSISSLFTQTRPQTSSTSSLSSETRPVAGSTGNLIGESEQQASTKKKRCRNKNKPLPEKNITTEITSERESKSIYKGQITDLHPLLGQIQTERGTLYFPRDNCYLYGLRLHRVELWHVLTIGIEAEYEIGTSVLGVSRVWIGGRDQPPPATLKSLLTCWCKKFNVPEAATDILLQQADLSSPSLFPTIGNDEGMETVEIIQDPS